MVMGCARSLSTLCSVCFTSFKILILNIWKKSGVRAGGGNLSVEIVWLLRNGRLCASAFCLYCCTRTF